MKNLFRLLCIVIILGMMSAPVLAANVNLGGVEVDETLIISPVSGKYSVTYTEADATELTSGQQIVLLVVKGVASTPAGLTISSDNIRYIDQGTATDTSISFSNFIPSSIPNCTVLISGLMGIDGPKIIGYIAAVPVNVSGTVSYLSGVVNRLATITLTEMNMPSYTPTANVFTVQSNTSGQFNIPLVTEGTYQLVATAQSHAKYTKNNISVVELDISGISGNLLSGDIDSNDVIEFLDLSAILSNYNQVKTDPADIDGNGVIEFLDLSAVLSNYNKNAIVE